MEMEMEREGGREGGRERERERERWNLGIEARDGLGNFFIKHKNNRSYAQNPRLLSVQKNHTS